MSSDSNRGIRSVIDKRNRKKNVKDKQKRQLIKDFPLFRALKPRQCYSFCSDYMRIDDSYAVILTILHDEGADDSLQYFWGIHLIPRNLGNDVSVRRLEHIKCVSENWVEQHQSRAEGLLQNQANETNKEGTMSARHRLNKQQNQLLEIAGDLASGCSYLRVAFRLMVKAPSLRRLDETIMKINRQYSDRFDTVQAHAYTGEQKRELSTWFNDIDSKTGRNMMFTSAEFAGSYSLVTRGIEDKTGEYIGQMEGDVNSSAVLMDFNNYSSHVVIAGEREAQSLSGFDFKGQRGADVWGIKLGVNALLHNHRVIHLVLNRTHVSTIGIDLSDITANVNMTQGDINPFECFGDKKDELSIFAAHIEKMYLMIEQLQPMTETQRARVKGELSEILNIFYTDKKMWSRNAQMNQKSLRLVGIPHDQVPRLPEFLAYLSMKYTEQVQARQKDDKVMDAYGFLRTAFKNMLDTNGDLFNTVTSNNIDRSVVSNRVIYDFSSLLKRGLSVMMAQFVNALSYAVGNLQKNDVVVLHGVDLLSPGVKQYTSNVFDQLHDHGVRLVYVYNNIDTMISDKRFNHFDDADYTLIGGMNKNTIANYEQTLKQEVPIVLKALLEHREKHRWYLRRGFDNIVFANDVQMGFSR